MEWYQAPPMMYNLKLRLKVRSNHEEAQRLPLLDRPDLSSSKISDLVGPLDGVYHRVCILPAMIISGYDYARIVECSFQTRIDCCAFDGSSTLLISLILPSQKKQAKSAIRYLTLDLDTVHRVPRVSRQHYGPPAVPKGSESAITTSNNSLASSTSSAPYQDYSQGPYSRTGSSTSITSPHGVSASKLKSLIGDDYVHSRPSPTPNGEEHSHLHAHYADSGTNTPSDGDRASPLSHRVLTDAERLSASVLSKQPVVFDKVHHSPSQSDFPKPADYHLYSDPSIPQTIKLNDVLARESTLPPRATKNLRSLATSIHPDFEADSDEIQEETTGEAHHENGFAKAVLPNGNGHESATTEQSIPKHDAIEHNGDIARDANGETKSGTEDSSSNGPQAPAEPSAAESSPSNSHAQYPTTTNTFSMTESYASVDEVDHLSRTKLDSSTASINDSSLLGSRARTSEVDLSASGYATPSSSSSSYSAQHLTPRDPHEGAEYIATELDYKTFGAEATTLALNRPTVSSRETLETLVGYSNGAILKFDPKAMREDEAEKKKAEVEGSSKKTKKVEAPPSKKTFNYDHKMVDGAVRKLAWFTTNQFMASYSDGFIYLFQSQCEDDPDFMKDASNPRLSRLKRPSTPSAVPSAIPSAPTPQTTPALTAGTSKPGGKEGQTSTPAKSTASTSSKAKKPTVISDDMPIPSDGWVADSMWLRVQKAGGKPLNPIGMWSISPGVPVTDYAISPDLRMLAATSKDGFLRIYSMTTYKLLVMFKSYFGGFTCFSWSPDSKYIVTGSEDDLISLWSVEDHQLVARGEGHSSWIGRITFDAHRCSSGSYYRFASVGHDSKLAIWEFSAETLVLPTVSLQRRKKRARSLSVAPTTHGFLMTFEMDDKSLEDQPPVVVAPPPKDQTCKIEPVVIQKVTTSPCSEVQFIGADLLFVGGWAGQCAFFLLDSHGLHGHNGLRNLPIPNGASRQLHVDEINSKLASSSSHFEQHEPSDMDAHFAPPIEEN